METTERIVESYVRYVKGWATIPNIRCSGQLEIDLLAIDPLTLNRYHIETSVSISSGFSRLTDREFSPDLLKQRVAGPDQRRTFGFFLQRKLDHPAVVDTLKSYGFEEGKYGRIIVSWDWTPGAAEQAERASVQLWRFGDLMSAIVSMGRSASGYFADDTLRTLHLYCLSQAARGKR